jgi:hypothetical protein
LIFNAYNVALLGSLFLLSVGFGVVFAWTRSLVPSFVAHAIINFPMTPRWQLILLAAFAFGAVVLWRPGVAAVKQVFSGASVVWCVALAVVGAGYAVLSQRGEIATYVAAAMLGLAVGLEAMNRGREKAAESISQG